MSKPIIKVAYADFWADFDPEHNIIADALREQFTLQRDDRAPDFLFFSNYGLRHLRYTDCVKIFYTGENMAPDFNQCDYAISACHMEFEGRNLYLPPCMATYRKEQAPTLPPLSAELVKRPFCSFIYSQARVGEGSKRRKAFCEKLMREYAHVDCPGAILHNVDAPELAARGDESNWNASKIRYLSKYKFNLAFENSDSSGYITEKLSDCYLGNTVPIYFGSCGNPAPFPKESMICVHDYADDDALIARIKEVNENDELYLAMLAANPLRHGMSCDCAPTLSAYLTPILKRGNHPFTKDVWEFGDAARLYRLRHGLSNMAARFRYLKTCITSAFIRDKIKAKEARRAMKYAMKDTQALLRR